MGACRRTLQEGFAPAALAPVHPPKSPPSPKVSIGATPLVLVLISITSVQFSVIIIQCYIILYEKQFRNSKYPWFGLLWICWTGATIVLAT